jgi:DNA repair protein RadA/Sms
MSKIKTSFFCQNGAQYANGKGSVTPKEWNTIAEEIIQNKKKVAWKSEATVTSKAPKPLK